MGGQICDMDARNIIAAIAHEAVIAAAEAHMNTATGPIYCGGAEDQRGPGTFQDRLLGGHSF
jgi:hypothetical protein